MMTAFTFGNARGSEGINVPSGLLRCEVFVACQHVIEIVHVCSPRERMREALVKVVSSHELNNTPQ